MHDFPHARQLGLISDTHGLLRPQALEALRGSELILHAGDVGHAEILAGLRTMRRWWPFAETWIRNPGPEHWRRRKR